VVVIGSMGVCRDRRRKEVEEKLVWIHLKASNTWQSVSQSVNCSNAVVLVAVSSRLQLRPETPYIPNKTHHGSKLTPPAASM